LADDEFEVLVERDIRELDCDALAAVLRSPEMIRRWYRTLLSMQHRLDDQLEVFDAQMRADQAAARLAGNKREVLALRAQAEHKRASAIRFKALLRARAREARQVRREMGEAVSVRRLIDERTRALNRSTQLERAIGQHRAAILDGAERRGTDKKLWNQIG
jgi:hypothetical protein